MKSSSWSIIGLGFVLAIAGCSSPEAEYGDSTAKNSYAETASPAESSGGAEKSKTISQNRTAPPSEPIKMNRAVIREGKMTVRVKEVEQAERDIVKWINGLGGYVDSSTSQNYGEANPGVVMNLRIPVGHFDQVLDELSQRGKITFKQLSSQDVTEQLIDIAARLKTLRLEEDRYLDLMRQAKGLDQIEAVQGKLSNVRTQIEQIAAKQKSLGELTALSKLELTLTQDAVTTLARTEDKGWANQAWGEATSSAGAFFKGVATMVIWLAVYSPLFLVLGGGGFVGYRRWKKTDPKVS